MFRQVLVSFFIIPLGTFFIQHFDHLIIETVIQSLVELTIKSGIYGGDSFMKNEIASKIDRDKPSSKDTTIFSGYF